MINALILAALVKLSLAVEKPIVPTAVFTLAALVCGLLFGVPFLALVVGTAINFLLSLLFFSLLKRTEGQGSWWAVLIGGLVVFIGLGFIR